MLYIDVSEFREVLDMEATGENVEDATLTSELETSEMLAIAKALDVYNDVDKIVEMVCADDWSEYATDMFDDCYSNIVELVDNGTLGDYVTIDYDKYAEQLQWDYSICTVDGIDYYYRYR